MELYFNKNAVKNKIQHYKVAFNEFYSRLKVRKPTSQEESDKVDEAGEESFPASDPPAHLSKSSEDRRVH